MKMDTKLLLSLDQLKSIEEEGHNLEDTLRLVALTQAQYIIDGLEFAHLYKFDDNRVTICEKCHSILKISVEDWQRYKKEVGL